MTLLPFLTAWDPTDLPGTSVDPLGFDRGYNWLADQLLPSLTNVASQPRYFSLLCAGASLGPPSESATPTRREIAARQDVVLRLERLWALGHAVLEREVPGAASGIRGITYAHTHLDDLERKKRRSTTTKFKLLLSQARYGALGIYGNVAAGLRLTERGTLSLTPDLGERIGEVFLEANATPTSVRRAAFDGAETVEVGLDDLAAWVRRAGVNAPMASTETALLAAAVNEHDRRKRLGDYLAKIPWDPDDESELDYLHRLEDKFTATDADLRDLAQAIQRFEHCYRTAMLFLERLLWRCDSEGGVALPSLASDPVLGETAAALPRAIREFLDHADGAESGALRASGERMTDLRRFLAEVAAAGGEVAKTIASIVQRHADVQAGKFVRGRAKLPWLEVLDGRLQLTLAQANQIHGEPTKIQDVVPHAFRLRSARALLFGNEVRA